MFTTHPVEKPYYIFQIGSADPALAVQAARVVQDDVAGIDLNCGCPKPFSTTGGMGAALLSTPDLLIDILRALRAALPARVALSAKIRLLPSQEDTLKLVERIVGTGIAALTVHCRTRNQRMREPAKIERLREIVHFVEGLNKNIAVIANGDCQSFEDAKRVRDVTRASRFSFSLSVLANEAQCRRALGHDRHCRRVQPDLLRPRATDGRRAHAHARLHPPRASFFSRSSRIPNASQGKYLDNHWSSTKWCIAQFKAPHPNLSKAEHKAARDAIMHAKAYADVLALAGGEEGMARGAEELEAIQKVLDEREACRIRDEPGTAFEAAVDGAPRVAPEDVSAATAARVEAALGGLPDAHEGAAASEPVVFQTDGLAAVETVTPSLEVEAPAAGAQLFPSADMRSQALATA
jgi:tRNA-dihydrouridine synthase 2